MIMMIIFLRPKLMIMKIRLLLFQYITACSLYNLFGLFSCKLGYKWCQCCMIINEKQGKAKKMYSVTQENWHLGIINNLCSRKWEEFYFIEFVSTAQNLTLNHHAPLYFALNISHGIFIFYLNPICKFFAWRLWTNCAALLDMPGFLFFLQIPPPEYGRGPCTLPPFSSLLLSTWQPPTCPTHLLSPLMSLPCP